MEEEKETQKKEVTSMSEEAMERITERLSCLENLYFPRALQSTATLPSQRKAIFRDLLSRDVALFLGIVLMLHTLLFTFRIYSNFFSVIPT